MEVYEEIDLLLPGETGEMSFLATGIKQLTAPGIRIMRSSCLGQEFLLVIERCPDNHFAGKDMTSISVKLWGPPSLASTFYYKLELRTANDMLTHEALTRCMRDDLQSQYPEQDNLVVENRVVDDFIDEDNNFDVDVTITKIKI